MKAKRKVELELIIQKHGRLQVPLRLSTFKPHEKLSITIESLTDDRRIQIEAKLDAKKRIHIPTRVSTFKHPDKVKVILEDLLEEN